MSEYIVSARKYRPTTFASVVGQRSIRATLKNAIRTGHLAHAYLFNGPRGVGKTTCARIFAKTINCTNLSPDTEPCNQCESCQSFMHGRSYNIHELDAASNNSVEDIRSLIEQVRIPPQIGKYSVYIIDEVHMLSAAAFNAFLKTLEEPPEHAIFVLATTEKHKILPTILSRCQIFDFSRITIEDTVNHLLHVAKQENLQADPEALHIIAQKADGGMRDALSTFDQIVSFCAGEITYDKVIDNLNVLDYEYYFKLTTAFLANDVATVMLAYDEILDKGFDSLLFISGLATHFRDLLVARDEQTLELLQVGESTKARYLEQAKICAEEFLFQALKLTNQCTVYYKASNNQRLHIELSLLELSQITKKKDEPLDQSSENQEEEKEDDKPAPKPEAAKPSRPVSISVKKTLETTKAKATQEATPQEQQTAQKQATAQELNEPFGQDELLATWLKYAEQQEQQQPRLASLFKMQKPVLKEASTAFVVTLNNSLQQEKLEQIRGHLLGYIRKELRNTSIEMEFEILKEKPKGKLYSKEDKLAFLIGKNNELDRLRQHFDLDFE